MPIHRLIHGLLTFVPGWYSEREKYIGGTDSARYCYAVWLRHLVIAQKNGLDPYPKIVAELGPGNSLGIGLAALISGCERYLAFDVVEHADIANNLQVFDELVALFERRDDIPGDAELPKTHPRLDTYDFPRDILTEDRLWVALDRIRLQRIRDSILNATRREQHALIQYRVPWHDLHVIEKASLDMIYSQATLEHVDDLPHTYKAMRTWLKPTGYLSHQIDFKCHGTADEWNGHWTYSDLMWKAIRGKRPYLLNRMPHSAHLRLLQEEGFRIVCDQTIHATSHLTKDALARRFRTMPDDDLITSGAFIQAAIRD